MDEVKERDQKKKKQTGGATGLDALPFPFVIFYSRVRVGAYMDDRLRTSVALSSFFFRAIRGFFLGASSEEVASDDRFFPLPAFFPSDLGAA